jgi:hypothetical protein
MNRASMDWGDERFHLNTLMVLATLFCYASHSLIVLRCIQYSKYDKSYIAMRP